MDAKFIIDTDENRFFLRTNLRWLLEFGENFPSESGSAYYLGSDGTPLMDHPKETWITCRMLQSYAIGMLLGKYDSNLLRKAVNGLLTELHDDKNGGWYKGINSDGSIIPGKDARTHALVITAASYGVLAGISECYEILNEALSIFDKYFWSDKDQLVRELWDTEFTTCDPKRFLTSNMYAAEAYLAVADARDLDKYRDRAGKILSRIVGWGSVNYWRLPEYFTSNWVSDIHFNKENINDPLNPYGAIPGHAIIISRLLVQWASSVYPEGNGTRKLYMDVAESIFTRAVGDSWYKDGTKGFIYTTNWKGEVIVHDRIWWVLAEAINTTSVLYRATGRIYYADKYAYFMEYLSEKVIDYKTGSWYHQLDLTNRVKDTIWPGKPDIYHAISSCLIPYSKIHLSISRAVKDRLLRI